MQFPLSSMKKFLLITSLFGILLTACGGSSLDPNAEPINIGFIAPLTGDKEDQGIDGLNGLKLAVNEINVDGGINGRPVRIFAEDGKCTMVDGAASAEKLVNVSKVVAIIGGYCKEETLGASPIAEKGKVALLSFGSGSTLSDGTVGSGFEGDFTESFGEPQSGFESAMHAYSAATKLFEAIESVGVESDAIRGYLKK